MVAKKGIKKYRKNDTNKKGSVKKMKGFSLDIMEGAIFDLDGTLVDSMALWQSMGSTYIKAQGLEPEPKLNEKLYSLTIMQAAEYFKKRYALELDHEAIVKGCNAVMEEAYNTKVFLKSGAKEFLDLLLKHNIPMYIATATDRHLVEVALKKLDIAGYFNGLITSTEAGSGKAESPAIFDIAREKIGTSLAKTIVFEDSFHGIETAKKAGYLVAALYDDTAKSMEKTIKDIADWYGVTFYDYMEDL